MACSWRRSAHDIHGPFWNSNEVAAHCQQEEGQVVQKSLSVLGVLAVWTLTIYGHDNLHACAACLETDSEHTFIP